MHIWGIVTAGLEHLGTLHRGQEILADHYKLPSNFLSTWPELGCKISCLLEWLPSEEKTCASRNVTKLPGGGGESRNILLLIGGEL
jgi:hypothetical protein